MSFIDGDHFGADGSGDTKDEWEVRADGNAHNPVRQAFGSDWVHGHFYEFYVEFEKAIRRTAVRRTISADTGEWTC